MAKKQVTARPVRGPKTGLYIDTHCHLLPGVDDGVQSWDEARACLDIARAERILHICVTPHLRHTKYPDNTPAALSAVFLRFRAEAEALGIGASLGCEAYFVGDIVRAFGDGELLAMGESGRFLLLELPTAIMPQGLVDAVFNLRIAGIEPLLAHAERYPWAQRDPGRLGVLALTEVPFQVTTHSLVGDMGTEAQRTAFDLMERGWVHVAASDAHSSTGRTPMFREAARVIANRYGKEATRLLCAENPRRMLAGQALLPVICAPKRRFFFL